MGAIVKFMGDFLEQFFVKGVWGILKGIGLGIANIFNIPRYITIFKGYMSELGAGGIVLAVLAIILVLAVLAGIVFLLVLLFRKYVRFRKTVVDQEELLNEVATLNREVIKLTLEKEKILAMKVSQLGLRPGESPYLEAPDGSAGAEAGEAEEGAEALLGVGEALSGFFNAFLQADKLLEPLFPCLVRTEEGREIPAIFRPHLASDGNFIIHDVSFSLISSAALSFIVLFEGSHRQTREV